MHYRIPHACAIEVRAGKVCAVQADLALRQLRRAEVGANRAEECENCTGLNKQQSRGPNPGETVKRQNGETVQHTPDAARKVFAAILGLGDATVLANLSGPKAAEKSDVKSPAHQK